MRKSTSTQSSAGSSAKGRGQGFDSRFPSGATRCVVVFAAVLLAGCGGDEIQHYRVERIPMSEPEAPEPQRLLGAIISHDDVTWFFKLTGPQGTVAHWQPAFETYLQSMRAE